MPTYPTSHNQARGNSLEDSRSTVESWRGERRARQHKSSWQYPDRTAQTSGKTPGSEKVAQKGFRVRKSLTLNLGLRYERFGQFGDNLGRNSSFDTARVNPNPPATGSLAGYIVGSNFSSPLPVGVERVGNTAGNYAEGQNTLAPRIGFSWQFLPQMSRTVLRGGYGIYYSRPTGQAFFQSVFGAPFSDLRISLGPANAGATFQTPSPPRRDTPAA